MTDRPRVYLVDDHRMFRSGVRVELGDRVEIVGDAGDVDAAVAEILRLQPDVVLVDVHLGDDDGLVLAGELHRLRPALRIVALTASVDPVNVARAAQAGVCAYLPKAGALDEVLNAVRTARVGRLLLQPDMVLDLVALEQRSSTSEPQRRRAASLTTREQQVLELLGEGMDVNAIGKRLGIRTSTCRGYVQNVLTKLDAHTQLEAVAQARARGLLGTGEGDGSRRDRR